MSQNITINQFALGDKIKDITINTFKGLPHGHASISDLGRKDFKSFSTKMKKLDDYVNKYIKDRHVRFIKMDVEGSEMLVIKGARKFLSKAGQVKLLFEINFETSAAFGYSPLDIFKALEEFGFGQFSRITHEGKLEKLTNYHIVEHGDNIVCAK